MDVVSEIFRFCDFNENLKLFYMIKAFRKTWFQTCEGFETCNFCNTYHESLFLRIHCVDSLSSYLLMLDIFSSQMFLKIHFQSTD